MNDKYYTPEISEFHHGFEFDIIPSVGVSVVNLGKPDQKAETKWATQFMSMKFGVHEGDANFFGTSFPDVASAIENKKIRVKHLDREDIESLGFEFVMHDNHPQVGRRVSKYVHESKLVIIYHNTGTGAVAIDTPQIGHAIKFITIKNKSELKRILKMIGV